MNTVSSYFYCLIALHIFLTQLYYCNDIVKYCIMRINDILYQKHLIKKDQIINMPEKNYKDKMQQLKLVSTKLTGLN